MCTAVAHRNPWRYVLITSLKKGRRPSDRRRHRWTWKNGALRAKGLRPQFLSYGRSSKNRFTMAHKDCHLLFKDSFFPSLLSSKVFGKRLLILVFLFTKYYRRRMRDGVCGLSLDGLPCNSLSGHRDVTAKAKRLSPLWRNWILLA